MKSVIPNNKYGAMTRITKSLLWMVWLFTLVACSSGSDKDIATPQMKFSVPGDAPLLRAIDDSSIQANLIYWNENGSEIEPTCSDAGNHPVLPMTFEDSINVWTSQPVPIPLGSTYNIFICWSTVADNNRYNFAQQSFVAEGANSNTVIDLSNTPFAVDLFDDDGDGNDNYSEILAGTPPGESPPTSTISSPDSVDTTDNGTTAGSDTDSFTDLVLDGTDTDDGFTDLDLGGTDTGDDGLTDLNSGGADTDDGFTDLNLGGTDSEGLTDGGLDSLVEDTDGDGIPDEDEDKVCKGLGGSDPSSNNAIWADNCWLQADIKPETTELDRSPFYNSTYTKGVQRILYCRGHGGGAGSIDDFANGLFSANTDAAVRDFQEAEGLIADGIVGPETWGKMQTLVEMATIGLTETDSISNYDTFGVLPTAEDSVINCRQQIHFFGRYSADAASADYDGWELAKRAGFSEKESFSTMSPGGTDSNGSTDSGTTTGSTDSGLITPSGGIVGVWFGNNNFGEGVMIVDANANVMSFAANGSGRYETVFGSASGNLLRFFHRDSDNPAFADSFLFVGDNPSRYDPNEPDITAYNLTVQNDGKEINHTGTGGDFSMAFATENDVAPISLESIAGVWTAKTSFCAADCNITLEMTFAADGSVSGSTQFNDNPNIPLSGTVEVAAGSTQYLNVSFVWAEKRRSGVIHLDRRDPTRLMINTVGPDDVDGESKSFSASMIRQ